ncbi:MAG: dihydroorotase [Phycisphaerae bacterium]
MSSILITNGTILDPSRLFAQRKDLLIRHDRIAAIGENLWPADVVIDATGCFVCPGLIDIHVHFREPGGEDAETIASGSAAAVAGGFTSVCCMPNTSPPLDNDAQIEFVCRQAAAAGLCNVHPIGALTVGRAGRELAEYGSMLARGAVGLSDDGTGVSDPGVMRKALQYARMFDTVVTQHCEEPTLSGGSMNAGTVSTLLGIKAVPPEAEELMIARDLLLNRRIGCRYHVQHISTAHAVELVRRAKRDGQRVSTEVSPHHLLLTDEMCRSFDTNYKMNPPLRTAEDVAACIAGVVDGTIDCLATDHAPHTQMRKAVEFDQAAFGILGMECALPLYVRALVEPGHIDWMKLIDLMSTRPAQVMRLDRGTLQPGAAADVTVIDPELQWTIDATQFKSRSRNTPFDGWDVTGRATHTIVNGRLVWTLETCTWPRPDRSIAASARGAV